MSDVWVCDLVDFPYPWRIYVFLFWERHSGDRLKLTQIQQTMVESALARGDEKLAEEYVQDFSYWNVHHRVPPELKIKQFVPGEHYYALGQKFDTYDEAYKHARRNGYKIVGVEKIITTSREGD